jgi:hypothetical protein
VSPWLARSLAGCCSPEPVSKTSPKIFKIHVANKACRMG